MNKLRKTTYISIAVLFIFTALIFTYVEVNVTSTQRDLDLKTQELKNQAVQDCFQAGVLTTKDGDTQRAEPIMYAYTLCLQDKGYSTTYKN